MVSAFSNPNMPPLMSAEAQEPGLFALGKANFQENMKDPVKGKIAQAMLQQSLAKMGQGFFGAAPMPSRQPKFDMNGNPLG